MTENFQSGIPDDFMPEIPHSRVHINADRVILNPQCGQAISQDVLLSRDMDCREKDVNSILTIVESDIVIECGGHKLIADENISNALKAESGKDISIVNCTTIGGTTGISLSNIEGAILKKNIVRGISDLGIVIDSSKNLMLLENKVFSETQAMAGIELTSCEQVNIAENTVHGFRLGGIQFYGVNHLVAKNNLVYQIGDTCFGFFDEKKSGKRTHHVLSKNNEAYECRNIGANEIMFGSHHLTFANNYFHNSGRGFGIYDPDKQNVEHLHFYNNRIENCIQGASIEDQTQFLHFENNHFIENQTGFAINNSNHIQIEQNDFRMNKTNYEPKSHLLMTANSNHLTFMHNNIFGYQNMLSVENGTNLNFKENYWDGCPHLQKFHSEQEPYLNLINPVDLNPDPKIKDLHTIMDKNSDGFDDQNCKKSSGSHEDRQ